jgi:hypothetical protein
VVTVPGIATAAGTRRARILAHLKQHPDLTAYELAKALGITSSLHGLLRAMERKGQVIATTEWRQQQGRRVSVWRIAPPETVPSPAAMSPEVIDRRRLGRRLSQQRRRARARGVRILPPAEIPVTFAHRAVSVLPPGAACLGANPDLFFPPEGDDGAEAKAICASCPIRSECYDLACANGEKAGIWGGEDFGGRSQPGQLSAGCHVLAVKENPRMAESLAVSTSAGVSVPTSDGPGGALITPGPARPVAVLPGADAEGGIELEAG